MFIEISHNCHNLKILSFFFKWEARSAKGLFKKVQITQVRQGEKNVGTSEERLTGMTTDVALQFENGPNG